MFHEEKVCVKNNKINQLCEILMETLGLIFAVNN